MSATITETCSCGATFTTTGVTSAGCDYSAKKWREQHRCSSPPTPGPCWDDSGVTLPGVLHETVRCELLAGHAGAHEATRPNGGTSVWTSGEAGA